MAQASPMKTLGCMSLGFVFMCVAPVVFVDQCVCAGPSKQERQQAEDEAKRRADEKQAEAERVKRDQEASKAAYDALLERKRESIEIKADPFFDDYGDPYISFTVTNKYDKPQDGIGIRCDFYRSRNGLQVDQKTYSFMRQFPVGKRVKTKAEPTGARADAKTVTCELLFAYDAAQ